MTVNTQEAKDMTDYQVVCFASKNFSRSIHKGKIIADDIPDGVCLCIHLYKLKSCHQAAFLT